MPQGAALFLQVLSERLKEHEDPQIRMELKAFIDAM
jgi:predicted metal-dependent hydrolase